ncbi:asparagine synthase-related protein [Natrarchaeobius oligotrophus]|uniref:Asparagine synthetase domain-containing protein n=1 Tax=Natrarchaeobius chitinivorans TaxID=1679083 RepID=A0A3N6NJQ5_NATCH|nr:asparagine synthase-related protein [Natrarchaeobius chitinivorans]RQG99362.1 hypothetical protein EA472_14135 [Natrarchaeobius chitinivorans]
MNRELFGVFGGIDAFERFRSRDEFDRVVVGPDVTVGLGDPGLDRAGWSDIAVDGANGCVVYGEAYAPDDEAGASWLLERTATEGLDALASFNGSYLAVIDLDGEFPFVVTDPIRSRECFYTDDPGVRVFGTDALAVARTIREPSLKDDGVLEFLHLGVTLGEKTWLSGLRRLPIDSRLTPDAVESLGRFVYEPREFDYVDELAARLSRAVRRRSSTPGRKGVLLSAGYDSRILLSQVSGIERSYTVGASDAQEVRGAKQLADQYGASHTALPPDERYLLADESKVRYSQGIKESLHIHHAGYTDDLEVETMYHGLLSDTLFRGHFGARDGVDVLGKRVPFERLDSDPDPVETLLEKFGYDRDASLDLAERTRFDADPEPFVRAAIADEFASNRWRANAIQNAITCCGIANQPSMPFHNHLADRFYAPFLATDVELVDWHLRTPPEHRTTETFLKACRRIDDRILRHRPPDRPRGHVLLNEVEGFIRRKTPLLSSFEPPWPDRAALFDRYDLDRRLFSNRNRLRSLPPRHKLRLNDVQTWFGACVGAEDESRQPLRASRAPSESGNG